MAGFVNTYAAPGASGDPATIVSPSPLSDTDPPICARASTSEGTVSLNVPAAVVHGVDVVNTYTEPGSSPLAPIAMVLPSWLADTDDPNASLAAPSDAVSLTVPAAVAQPASGFVNTYAAPAPVAPASLPGAPTTMALPSPLRDTQLPKPSPAAPSDAVSLIVPAAFAHPASGFVNT